MRLIPMTLEQVASFWSQFKGDRVSITWSDGNLEVPDDLYDSIIALDLSVPPTGPRLISMTLEQVESFSAQFKGDREHIVWNDGKLEVPDDLYDSIMSIDLTIPPPMFSGSDLTDLKKQASAFVDNTAEEQRQRWVTPGEGQAMTYQAKAQEAATYLNLISNNLAVDPARFPFLFAEIGVSGKTLEEVARTIDDVHQKWARLAAGIERARLNAKSSIAGAQSGSDIQTVLDGIQWPEAPVADAPATKKSKTK